MKSYIADASAAAFFSEFSKYKIGVALYDKSMNCISWGWNKRKTHPRQKKYADKVGQGNRLYLHAEIDALIKVRSVMPYTIVVVRTTSKGLGMARPCPICMRAIKEAGVREIYYSDKDGALIKEYIY